MTTATTVPSPTLSVAIRRPTSARLIPAAFILFTILCAVFSTGFFEPYDEILHFLYAKSVWSNPAALLNIWARPGCTALFALAAPFGMTAAHLLAAGITTLTALATVQLANHFLPNDPQNFFHRHKTALLWLLLFAQPCFALNSFTTMTEMPLACAWTWAAVALANRRAPIASVLIGLAGLLRPEAWIAIACWPVFITLWQRANCTKSPRKILLHTALHTLLAGLPTLLWYLAGALHSHDPLWFKAWWPWAPASPYGKTGLFFLASAAIALAIWMWLPLALGINHILNTSTNQKRINALLLLILPLAGFFLMHGILGTLGLFGSMSLPRYFIAVAPQAAILTLLGLASIQRKQKLLQRLTITLALLPILALALTNHLPAQKNLTLKRYDLALNILRQRNIPTDKILAAHPYLLYQLHTRIDHPGDLRIMNNHDLATQPVGTHLLLDTHLWNAEHRASPSQLQLWGYMQNPAVTETTNKLHPTLPLLRYPGEIAQVELWIRQK
jgi:hypothetical protein